MSSSTRILRSLAGDLYERESEASVRSLESLRDVLRSIGFFVEKRHAKEDTLRAYVGGWHDLPLLNPRFYHPADSPVKIRKECRYLPELGPRGGAVCRHGHFVLPLQFTESGDGISLTFTANVPDLKRVYEHLKALVHRDEVA